MIVPFQVSKDKLRQLSIEINFKRSHGGFGSTTYLFFLAFQATNDAGNNMRAITLLEELM